MSLTNDAASDDLLTTREVAGRLRVSTATVLRRFRSGEIPAVQLGPRTLRFRRSDIDALLDPAASLSPEEVGS
jgi:excisionase family DNA binding protein